MVTNIESRKWSDLAIPPGELLEEELAAVGMTQQELATRAGRPVQVVNEIIRGKKAITHDTALEFEKVLGIPAHVWVNLESAYQLTLAKNKERESLRNQEEWLSEFPVEELEKREWIQKYSDKSDTVRALLEYLGVASFQAWRQAIVGLRVSAGSKVSLGALAIWMRRGEIAARDLQTEPYDEGHFRQALSSIRSMTSDHPKSFLPQMTRLCAEAGVVFVVIRELPKSGANGVARWLTPEKALIQMSLRWRWSDVFWFSFFHEACHILSHRVRQVYINGVDGEPQVEAEADRFSRDFLVPLDAWVDFVNAGQRSPMDIRNFAKGLGIDAGIVVGRMQHEKLIPYKQMTSLKRRFIWKEDSEG